MSIFIATCPGCLKQIGVPRPGSVVGEIGDEDVFDEDIKTACPFCEAEILSSTGRDVAEPRVEEPEFDLLSVE